MEKSRELYWNVPEVFEWLMYGLLIIAVIIFALGLYCRFQLWRLGAKDSRFDRWFERFKRVITYAFLQGRIIKQPYAGLLHALIFGGMGLLFIGTLIVMAQADFSIKVLYGTFYLWFSLITDLAGLGLGLGLAMAFARRYIIGSKNLDNRLDDLVVIVLLSSAVITGFILEGIRINLTELGKRPDLLLWSPIGAWCAYGFQAMTLKEPTLLFIHKLTWFIHLMIALVFIAYIPYSKLWHIISTPLNIFFSDLELKGALSKPDLETAETFGVASLKDLTWKDLLDLDACTRCGRCQADCPAYLSDKPLSPRQLIVHLKEHLDKAGPELLKAGRQKPEAAPGSSICPAVLPDDIIWACTTCGFCQEHCPVLIEHIDKIIELRRNLVLAESRFPAEAKTAFKNMETNGNPWPVSWDQRAKWAGGLDIPVLSEGNKETDYLFWVGCAGSTDDRNIKVARALVNILKKAGIKFAILGNQERCCGDPARRLGNEYLFQMLADENVGTLKKYRFKEVITCCPHCLNTLKNEYTQWGMNLKVQHHTQFIQHLLETNQLKLSRGLKQVLTFHDSCYLGRYNEIYQPPREVLRNISGIRFKEMARARRTSFCCGAGGGRMWLEEKIGKRINQIRVEEASKTKAELIATACPYCLTMLEDGVKEKEMAESMKVKDIAEMVNETL